MTTTTAIIVIFILGYACIALESVLKVNKAAVALMMCVGCWTLFAVGGLSAGYFESLGELGHIIEKNLGEAGTTLFFLMGAMTIVEVVDQHGGFNPVRKLLATRSKRSLLWRFAFVTAILSAVLDNLTTSIVMIMILRKLVYERNDRMIFAAMIIIAANSGGAFSPIGDVTTIMLWNGKMITAGGVITEIIIPSFVSFIVPCFILQYSLQGDCGGFESEQQEKLATALGYRERMTIFILGVGGLCCVPVFHMATNLPPFMGILCVLGILWLVLEIFYRHLPEDDNRAIRVTKMLSRIDITTILFFLGILMAVAVLAEIGTLQQAGEWLDESTTAFGSLQHYVVTGAIGILSSIVDNVPLVAGAMKMYVVEGAGDFGVDGLFWQLLAYCAGVGGSMLIIGSAAGVTVMGMERISFGWYLKKITWVAFVGYICGIGVYYVEKLIF